MISAPLFALNLLKDLTVDVLKLIRTSSARTAWPKRINHRRRHYPDRQRPEPEILSEGIETQEQSISFFLRLSYGAGLFFRQAVPSEEFEKLVGYTKK